MAQEGCVTSKGGKYFVNIDVTCAGSRYHFEGPPRHASQTAQEDLDRIRASAESTSSRRDRLELMQVAGWRSPRNPGRAWAPIFLKSNTYRYIGTLSLLFGFHLLIYWAPAVDFLTYWALV